MKVNLPTRQVLAKAIRSQLQRTDGELDVPPLLLPLVFIPSPLQKASVNAIADIQNRSFVISGQASLIGAAAATSNVIVTIGKGLWWFVWNWSIQFTGTTQTANFDSLDLIDPKGASAQLAARNRIVGQETSDQRGEFAALIDTDGWTFNLTFGTTVAGDILTGRASVVGILQI